MTKWGEVPLRNFRPPGKMCRTSFKTQFGLLAKKYLPLVSHVGYGPVFKKTHDDKFNAKCLVSRPKENTLLRFPQYVWFLKGGGRNLSRRPVACSESKLLLV